MVNRRDVLKQTGAVVLGLTGATHMARGANGHVGVRSVVRRDETLLRLGGVGDGFKMTWGADDRQYLVVNEGSGWLEKPTALTNSQLWAVSGQPQHAAFAPVSGYPDLSEAAHPAEAPRYFGQGVLAVRGRLYQFLSTLDRAADRPRHWIGAKLIYSIDQGRSWRNQDGTTPVVWEDWGQQSRQRLTFFQEPQECFGLLSILQMGREYSANRDGYVYVYGPNGNVDGRMNELVMFRAPIDEIANRRAYEFFGGRQSNGKARWVKDIDARAVVHTFPRGWVNSTNLFPDDLVIDAWVPSVVYNESLELYVMASAGIGCAPDGTAFGKPGYLGLWVSATPWGPWRQIHEETAWTPGADAEARAYAPQIAPKWMAADGKSLWLVWADLKGMQSFGREQPIEPLLEKTPPEQRGAVTIQGLQRFLPGYSCNAQRVDLILS